MSDAQQASPLQAPPPPPVLRPTSRDVPFVVLILSHYYSFANSGMTGPRREAGETDHEDLSPPLLSIQSESRSCSRLYDARRLHALHHLANARHLAAANALGRLLQLERLEPVRHVDLKLLRLEGLERLLLGLHDVGQCRVARLVQPEIGRDDHRQLAIDRLESAVDLASHPNDAFAYELDLGRKRSLRPAPEASEDLTRLARVAVNRLLAEQDEVKVDACRLRGQDRSEDLGNRERLGRRRGFRKRNVDRVVLRERIRGNGNMANREQRGENAKRARMTMTRDGCGGTERAGHRRG